MQMKEILLDTFNFNDQANLKILEKIKDLPAPDECIKHFSHLVNSQIKWMERIKGNPQAVTMGWWEPLYPIDEIKKFWENSLKDWVDFIKSKSDQEIVEVVNFVGYDGAKWEAKISDIALQLNFHSFHHRAQMQLFIRAQGVEPDFIDYIGSRYKRIG